MFSKTIFLALLCGAVANASFGRANLVMKNEGIPGFGASLDDMKAFGGFGFPPMRPGEQIPEGKAILKQTEVTGKLPKKEVDCGSLPMTTENDEPVLCLAVGKKAFRVILHAVSGYGSNLFRVENVDGKEASESETIDAVNKLLWTLDQLTQEALRQRAPEF